jgi:hypothetical protein
MSQQGRNKKFMENNIDDVSEFNCRFPGEMGPEPTNCNHCGNVLVPDRETASHCDRLCFEAWQKEAQEI